jgi:hypothetical protein
MKSAMRTTPFSIASLGAVQEEADVQACRVIGSSRQGAENGWPAGVTKHRPAAGSAPENLVRFTLQAVRAATRQRGSNLPDAAGYPPGVVPGQATRREIRSSAGVTR